MNAAVRAWPVFVLAASCVAPGCSLDDRAARAVRASLEAERADPLAYYAAHSPATDPGEHHRLLVGLPREVAGIVRVVQGVLIQESLASSWGISRRRIDREIHIATVGRKLARIAALDDRPLAEPRPPRRRLAGVCAHYAMLTTALLRHHGIPARTRGGFEAYFSESFHHDHWITEYWEADEERWVRVDAEIDDPFRRRFDVDSDALDLPPGRFLTGADAWRLCRPGRKPPRSFGIAGEEWLGGWSFVVNELVLDFNALNKVESLPWDRTQLDRTELDELTAVELGLLDELAATVSEGDAAFARIRQLFKTRPRLRKTTGREESTGSGQRAAVAAREAGAI